MNIKKSKGKRLLCTSRMLTAVIVLSVFTIGIGILPASAQEATVTRNLPDYVEPNETFTVTLTQSGFWIDVGTVWEVLPEGFEYVDGSYTGGGEADWNPATRTLKVQFFAQTIIEYSVIASSYDQTAAFSGTYRAFVLDPILEEGDVTGDTEVVVEEEGADTTPPAAINDLATSNPTTSSIDLTWTAPGDDGTTGTATEYDIRYLAGTTPITDANWAAATQCTGEPAPQAAGLGETFTVTGLAADTDYCFAIKTEDEVPNLSPVSNSPCGTTLVSPDTTPPAQITNLATSNPTPSSINLTWTAPGDDGTTGTATEYDIRYLAGTTPITDANWAAATQCTGEPTPQVAGSSETFTVTGLLSGTTYCFAIKTRDEVPLWSPVSNSPCGSTTTELLQYNLSLVEGDNMFGVPLNVSDWSLPTVLSSIDGNYSYLYWYNATSGVVEYYDPLDPGGSTLNSLEPGAGYVITMTENATAAFEGTKLMEIERSFKTGDNMFSIPYGVVDKTLPTVLTSINGKYSYLYWYNATSGVVEYYDPLDPGGSTLNSLEPGAGYVITMTEDAVFIPDMGL